MNLIISTVLAVATSAALAFGLTIDGSEQTNADADAQGQLEQTAEVEVGLSQNPTLEAKLGAESSTSVKAESNTALGATSNTEAGSSSSSQAGSESSVSGGANSNSQIGAQTSTEAVVEAQVNAEVYGETSVGVSKALNVLGKVFVNFGN